MREFLVIIHYSNGLTKRFTITAKKLLTADWLIMNKYRHLLAGADRMSVEDNIPPFD